LITKMGPWLQATKQGMWLRQLPLVEQPLCIGWLLYSAPEYNLGDLCWQIKQITGVEVALRFHCIKDSIQANKEQVRPGIKAIHMEVNNQISYLQLTSIKRFTPWMDKTSHSGSKCGLYLSSSS